MRTLWRGAIGFGLVSVPVRLYSGVQSRSVRFRQLSRSTGAPVRQRRVDARTGEEVVDPAALDPDQWSADPPSASSAWPRS